MSRGRRRISAGILASTLFLALAPPAFATDSTAVARGTVPFSEKPDSAYVQKHLFPLWQEKVMRRAPGRKLPPPYGVMLINNWMDSDWEFQSALVNLGGSNPISLDAAEEATMDLNINTSGFKADLWFLPFLNLFAGAGEADITATLGLRDIPLYYDAGGTARPPQYVYGDAIVPMRFNGTYYSLGLVLAGAYKHFYGAMDASWVKTSLDGTATLSEDGFWTFTAAPKIGYNAGLSQIYVGARYVSKNEHYTGTVALASGNDLDFDVKITTHSWAPNCGMRTVIQDRWEVLLEVAGTPRHQTTAGIGYRW